MFGFLDKRMAKEHMKLMYQNDNAWAYLQGFYGEDAIAPFEQQIQSVQDGWKSGKILGGEDAEIMLEVNDEFRRLYDATPKKYTKSFDNEYVPLIGWNEFYKRSI